MSLPYDRYYYARCCGLPYERNDHWLAFFDQIAERIRKEIAPRSVLDVGCAFGFLVERLRQKGIEAYGIDISEHAIHHADDAVKPYLSVASAVEPFSARYDLIVCIEVLEHLSPAEARKAVENICMHTDDVLFSSTPFDYAEPTHINVHPPGYWVELFAEHGLVLDESFDASFISPWAFRCRRTREPVHKTIGRLGGHLWQLSYENQELRRALIAKEAEVRSALAERDALAQRLDMMLVDHNQCSEAVRHLVEAHLQAVPCGIFPSRWQRWLSGVVVRPLVWPYRDLVVLSDHHWQSVSDDPQMLLLGVPGDWLDPVYVEVIAAGEEGGNVSLYVDTGAGFVESSRYTLGVLSPQKRTLGAWVRPGVRWRLDPLDRMGYFQLFDIRLRHVHVGDLLKHLGGVNDLCRLIDEVAHTRSFSIALLSWLRAKTSG